MQFLEGGRYMAVEVDGTMKTYGKSGGAGQKSADETSSPPGAQFGRDSIPKSDNAR